LDTKILSYTERKIRASDVTRLYNDLGWWEERVEQDIEEMLNRVQSVGAWKNDTLIGFARAVSDGKFRASGIKIVR
jgi:hypothetical protein